MTFPTPTWLEGEVEASAQAEAGFGLTYESDEALLDSFK